MKQLFCILLIISLLPGTLPAQTDKPFTSYDHYLTSFSPRSLNHLTLQKKHRFDSLRTAWDARIAIEPDRKSNRGPAFRMLGFGSSLTGSDLYNFVQMGAVQQEAALRALFDPKTGLNWNLMRIGFGSSDWDRDANFYTYNDRPAGQTDEKLAHFSVQEDEKRGHFALMRQILQINPEVKFIASVWSPPAWMKDSKRLIINGAVMPQYYEVYARYLVRTVQEYEKRGVPIHALTPQNEPLCNDGRKTPQALYLNWRDMRDILLIISREFKKANVKTQLWMYDMNFDAISDYVLPLMSDPNIQTAVQGVAWHDYGSIGTNKDLLKLIEQFPDMPHYLTERSNYNLTGLARITQLLRSGLRSYMQWTTYSDEFSGPFQWNGGSDSIRVASPDIHQSKPIFHLRDHPDIWFKTKVYYNYGQLTRFVQRGAVLIESSEAGSGLSNVAFQNPNGEVVLLVVNPESVPKKYHIAMEGQMLNGELPAQSSATYIFKR